MSTVKRNPVMIGYARLNRQAMTEAEVRIWRALRYRVLGVRFRRQHPVGPYILDFACLELRLAIELDGSQHGESDRDLIRDAYLERLGWTVLRFWTTEAPRDTDSVIDTIAAWIEDNRH